MAAISLDIVPGEDLCTKHPDVWLELVASLIQDNVAGINDLLHKITVAAVVKWTELETKKGPSEGVALDPPMASEDCMTSKRLASFPLDMRRYFCHDSSLSSSLDSMDKLAHDRQEALWQFEQRNIPDPYRDAIFDAVYPVAVADTYENAEKALAGCIKSLASNELVYAAYARPYVVQSIADHLYDKLANGNREVLANEVSHIREMAVLGLELHKNAPTKFVVRPDTFDRDQSTFLRGAVVAFLGETSTIDMLPGRPESHALDTTGAHLSDCCRDERPFETPKCIECFARKILHYDNTLQPKVRFFGLLGA